MTPQVSETESDLVQMERHVICFDHNVAGQPSSAKPATKQDKGKKNPESRRYIFRENGRENLQEDEGGARHRTTLGLWSWSSQQPLSSAFSRENLDLRSR